MQRRRDTVSASEMWFESQTVCLDESINKLFGEVLRTRKTPNSFLASHSLFFFFTPPWKLRPREEKKVSHFTVWTLHTGTYVMSIHFLSLLVPTLGAPREEPGASFSLVYRTADIDKHHTHCNTAGHFEFANSACFFLFLFVVVILDCAMQNSCKTQHQGLPTWEPLHGYRVTRSLARSSVYFY